MTDITIPPEALEAGKDTAFAWLRSHMEDNVRVREMTDEELTEFVSAACLAMLKAWPGMHLGAPWVIGVPTALLALVVLWFAPQRLHQLSKRWLVRVPAGWVVHDAVLLADNILVRTHELQSMAIAPSTTEAFDLTGLTRGTPLEICLRDSTTVRLTPFAARITKTLDVVHTKAILVAPTRVSAPLSK